MTDGVCQVCYGKTRVCEVQTTSVCCMGIGLYRMGIGLYRMGIDLYCMGIDLYCMGIDLYRMGIDLYCIGIGLYCMGIGLYCIGIGLYFFNTYFQQLQVYYYSRICFFFLLHPRCSHAQGILFVIHAPYIGSAFSTVNTKWSLAFRAIKLELENCYANRLIKSIIYLTNYLYMNMF